MENKISVGNKLLRDSELTYREWLIGMIASNAGIMNSALERTEAPIKNESEFAEVVVTQADAIVKQLDKEAD